MALALVLCHWKHDNSKQKCFVCSVTQIAPELGAKVTCFGSLGVSITMFMFFIACPASGVSRSWSFFVSLLCYNNGTIN